VTQHSPDWCEIHLEDAVDQDSPICYGIVLPGGHCDGGVPVIKVKDIAQGSVRSTGILQTSPEIDAKYKRSRLRDGDILLSIRGTVGRLGIVPKVLTGANITQDTARIRISCPEMRSYIYQALQSGALRSQIRGHVVGQAVKGINIRDVKRLKLLLPVEGRAQSYIAELLSTQDAVIQKTEQLIAAKERHYSHELSRLISRGRHPHARTGDIAEEVSSHNRGGRYGVLAEFLTESREPDTERNPAKRLTVRLHLQGVEARPVRGTESDGATAYFRRRAGQLIYGKQNIFRGAIGIIPPALDGYSSTQDLPAFDIADGVDPKWLYFWLSRKKFYASLEALAAGSGSKRLHPEEFFRIRIYLPDHAIQTAVAGYLGALREEIDLLGQFVEALKTQKRGLMQKLLTGKWRLPIPQEVTA
jgi:type I restriction enzyme S subunit